MTNKLDLKSLEKVDSPVSLDKKVLRYAQLKIAPKQYSFGKLTTYLSAAYCFGLITMSTVNQYAPHNHSVDNITAKNINLDSLRVATRSGYADKSKVDLNTLNDKQLKHIAKVFAANEQWKELEKLTLFIQKRSNNK